MKHHCKEEPATSNTHTVPTDQLIPATVTQMVNTGATSKITFCINGACEYHIHHICPE
jgi:hypothetical protein